MTQNRHVRTFSIDDIRSWKPCYDPAKHLPEKWEGTVFDILRHETIPTADKLWVVCREELIDEKTLRLFAVWCARQVQHLMKDERSIAALDIAEKYAHGHATKYELHAAQAAALDAAWDAARDTASAAAWDAARDTAQAAAWDAARDTAREAARDAARDTAQAAAWDAAREADSAAVWDAVRAAQVRRLIEMLEAKEHE